MSIEELLRHENEPGRAKSTLDCACLDKGLLNGTEFAAGIEMLNRLDILSIDECGEIQTARYSFAIDDRRAAAAKTLATALASAKEIKLLQKLDKVVVQFDLCRDRHAV